MSTRFTVMYRDRRANYAGYVDQFESLKITIKHNDVGGWELKSHYDNPAIKGMLNEFTKVDASSNPINAGVTGIVVFDNVSNKIVFSGPIRKIQVNYDKDKGTFATLSGGCDNIFLAERILTPKPQSFQSPTYTTTYDQPGSVYSAVGTMRYFLQNDIGDSTFTVNGTTYGQGWAPVDEARKIGYSTDYTSGVMAVQANISFSGTIPIELAKVRMDNLLLKFQDIAAYSESKGYPITFRLIQVASGVIQFQHYAPNDYSGKVIFAPELGNILSYEYVQQAPIGNNILVGGQGQGNARVFAYAGDEPSKGKWGRIELFKDSRQTTSSTSNTADLVEDVYQELKDNAELTTIKIEPVDIDLVSIFRDYTVGDRVQVRILNSIITDIVREAHIDIEYGKGDVAKPIIGKSPRGNILFLEQMKAMEYRLINLESSQ